ncbi:dioxygenase [Desulfuromonas versatilis]|uniref:Dioxygenase n=1 Tax=Desulfuromonas versatilis TaxID=2802975 RepID=A0ABN6DT73_9BACT|nr:carotenoid oxygenase family protein [Desulfuromonas versatilis]BCR03216.1 dioxygenase [Desulfuromonas versatilis]
MIEENKISRRSFLSLLGASAMTMTLAGCRTHGALAHTPFRDEDFRRLPALGLATSLTEEFDYSPRVEGTLPAGLRGTLYRNGPGLFEREGLRKRCLLDGDGMVQAFRIGEGQVRYRNRFVRTRKYNEESAAGKFLYSTWSTQAPGGVLANLGGGTFQNQAGITVVVRDGRLYAFDEFNPPYELDPLTLDTRGENWLGLARGATVFSAHSKLDPRTGDWIFFGLEFERAIKLHLTVLGADGALKMHRVTELPRFAYIHDFFITERHILLNLHPLEMKVWGFLLGRRSMIDSMRWRPEWGNLILVFDRAGDAEPVQLRTEASWMWHSLNAYELGDEIVADFVGYRDPDHFLGEDPALFAIMEGRQGSYENPGELRRYILSPRTGKVRQELLASGDFEFPFVNPRLLGSPHDYGYLACRPQGEPFFTAVSRVDSRTGKIDSFDFGPGVYCSEPVFAPKPPSAGAGSDREEAGWILTQIYDGQARKSALAILDAQALGDGPVARVLLGHHVPLGFHGFWQQATPAQGGMPS